MGLLKNTAPRKYLGKLKIIFDYLIVTVSISSQIKKNSQSITKSICIFMTCEGILSILQGYQGVKFSERHLWLHHSLSSQPEANTTSSSNFCLSIHVRGVGTQRCPFSTLIYLSSSLKCGEFLPGNLPVILRLPTL